MQDEFCSKLLALKNDLFRYAKRLTNNSEDSNDLIQDTFLKAIIHQNKYQKETNFKAWVFTILKNSFINEYRRKRKVNSFIDVTPDLFHINLIHEKGFISPESVYNEKELLAFIDQLDEKIRIPFQMYIEGFKYEEISERLKIKLGTIKSRIFFARKTLINNIKYDKLKSPLKSETMEKEISNDVNNLIVLFRQTCKMLIDKENYNKSKIVKETTLFWTTLEPLLEAPISNLSHLRQATIDKMRIFCNNHQIQQDTYSNIQPVEKPEQRKTQTTPELLIVKEQEKKKMLDDIQNQPIQRIKPDTFWSLFSRAMDCGIPENIIIEIKINNK